MAMFSGLSKRFPASDANSCSLCDLKEPHCSRDVALIVRQQAVYCTVWGSDILLNWDLHRARGSIS